MVKKLILFVCICLFVSCNENEPVPFEVLGEWKLIQMSGSIPNSETTGADMEYQERYIFNEDKTFQRIRDTKGTIAELSGVYKIYDTAHEKTLELIYSTKNQMIGSCTSELKELMNITSNSTFSSTWQACDGPGLDYEKITTH